MPHLGNSLESVVTTGSKSIALGLQLSLPFLMIGFIINLGLGFINKAMPQMMVFFVGQPVIIIGGLFLLNIILPTLILTWSGAFDDFLAKMF
jgi:flagellar biosynthetic protein FliR